MKNGIGKLKIGLALVLSFCIFDIAVANPSSPEIFVNGNKVSTNAIVVDNRTYVPLAAVSEALGANVKGSGTADRIDITLSSSSNDTLVPNIIQKVSPSVVGIIGNYSAATSSYNDKTEYTAHGTGVIIKSGGEILTNAHVVKDLKNIIVVLYDGSAYSAKIKNIDEKSDLAVVKIDKVGLPIVTFSSMDNVVTGKSVIAIGTPISFSLRNSASMGIISGINRGLSTEYALIQTDAAINPGNSGGPLVNMAGEVVGINSNKFAAVGIESMGFAIPADTVQYVISNFDKYGVVVRPELGATFEESWAARRGLPTSSGLTIKKISDGSIGQKAGLQNGDVIMSIDGVKVNSIVDYNECMKKYVFGNVSKTSVSRGGQIIQVDITY